MTEETVYQSEITSCGSEVSGFVEMGMLVIFSDSAPEELQDMAVIHRHPATDVTPQVGDRLEVDGKEYTVSAVGDVAAENFRELGHVTIKANGLTESELPGDVSVEVAELALPAVGGMIRIRRGVVAS